MRTSKSPGHLNPLDRGLYALFAQHADGNRHDRDRERYRAADIDTDFDLYLSRVYGLAWCLGLVAGFVAFSTFALVPGRLLSTVTSFLKRGLPVVNRVTWPDVPQPVLTLVAGVILAVLVRRLVISAGGTYLKWVASARRTDIEATLPGAVRYLRVLASGEHDQRAMLRRVADQDAYGETAVAFRRALNRAALTGSLDDGLERVASETPSRDVLAPFLLKFREHANQSANALEGYLEMEGRLLSHDQSRRQERATGYLELVAELFVVLLVLPALLVLIVTVMGVLSPGLSAPVATPVGTTTVRGVLVLGSALFVLAAGAAASLIVATLRPRNATGPAYELPDELLPLLESASVNPASTTVLMVPVGASVAVGLWLLGYRVENVLLLSYATFGLPIGAVSVRRARLDDAKDREIQDFVHAVSGHVSLGRPFADAVERVAREVELGALQSDVDDLAFTLGLTSSPPHDATDGRAAALDRFVESVGTPMADQTIGLVVGALDAGSDAEDVFETLQTEIGTLYHNRKALRSSLLVYVAVGWTTALLVIGIVVAVNTYVLDEFAQLSTVSGGQGLTIDPNAIDRLRRPGTDYRSERYRPGAGPISVLRRDAGDDAVLWLVRRNGEQGVLRGVTTLRIARHYRVRRLRGGWYHMTSQKSLDRVRGHAGGIRTTVRGQSHVVGVVLLLGLTAVAMGGLTASIGVIIEDQTGHADASSVVADFDSALRPVETTGSRRGRVTFTEGTVTSVSREIRILDDGGVVETVDADALAYSSGDRRVAFVGGAIVRGSAGSAWIERRPSVTSGPGVLVVGAPRLNGTGSVGGTGGVSTALATNVTHSRTPLGAGDYSVAIETETPAAFDQYVATRNATATTRDLDGDGVPSAVIDYRGERTAYLVVHDMRLEVGYG